METSGKQIRALAIIVASSALLGLVAAALGSLLVAALALGACLLGAVVLITRKERSPDCSPFPVPRELDELIAWCLKKDPGQRPQSASELSERLRAIPLAEGWSKVDAEAWWTAANLHESPENSPAA
ncbi:MAG: hypothetical protein ABW061_12035 [Polyangiaceae bacterium]